jgi:hypothetical protein
VEVCILRVHDIQVSNQISACAGGRLLKPAPVAHCELLVFEGRDLDATNPLRLHRFRIPVAELEAANLLYQLAGA